MLEARFDDLTRGGTSFRLADPVGVLEATRLAEVGPTIAAADAAARRGLWVGGFVAYEAAPGLDPSLRVRERAESDPLPLAWFAMFDRREDTQLPEPPDTPGSNSGAWEPSVDRSTYETAIAEIHERIASGDTYQVNHTLRLRSLVRGDVRGLYRDLCFAQRGAYAGYLDTGRMRIASASPELFFRIDGDRLTTRPMKGTAPRGRWPEEDEEIRAGLRGSVKDRAENAMIVDLLRNDLGRIARAGSVRWSDVFDAERYETVWQLTSTVSCAMDPKVELVDVFRALFPSGSVTGAPKVATMETIARLEDSPRGVYCGSVGFVAPSGHDGPRARFNVAIRTVVVDAEDGAAEYGVGGGITWDSRAASEYDETVAKARVLTARRPRFELLESLLHDPGRGFARLEEHLTRLRGSAAYFGFAYDEEALRAALESATAIVPDRPAKVRLLLDRRGKVSTGAAPVVSSTAPVTLAVDRAQPVDPSDVLLFHKTTLRARFEEAHARHPDADDVLLINTRGFVTEATSSNVAALIDGIWWTPSLDDGLLPGTERAALLATGELKERSLSIQDLRDAHAIEILNSVRGRRGAILVDD